MPASHSYCILTLPWSRYMNTGMQGFFKTVLLHVMATQHQSENNKVVDLPKENEKPLNDVPLMYNSRCLVYGTAQTYIPEYVGDSRQLTKTGHTSKFAQTNNIQAGAPTPLKRPIRRQQYRCSSSCNDTDATSHMRCMSCFYITVAWYRGAQTPSLAIQLNSASHGHTALPWTALSTGPHCKCSFFSPTSA